MLLGPERRWRAAVAACQITMVLSDCAGGKSTADAPASDAGVALADAGGDGALIEDAQACAQPLFGQPGAHTGLNAEQCAPRCGCAGAVWTPRSWDAAALDALRATELVDGAPVPAVDPYAVATLDVAPVDVSGTYRTYRGHRPRGLTRSAVVACAIVTGAVGDCPDTPQG